MFFCRSVWPLAFAAFVDNKTFREGQDLNLVQSSKRKYLRSSLEFEFEFEATFERRDRFISRPEMFVNKSDVNDVGMSSDLVHLTDNDAIVTDDANVTDAYNVTDVTDAYNDTYSVEADSRMFVVDAEDDPDEPRRGGQLLPKPLPGFLQVQNLSLKLFTIQHYTNLLAHSLGA